MYLFGWKQEFNCARSVPRTCHFWESHDATLALRERSKSLGKSRNTGAHSLGSFSAPRWAVWQILEAATVSLSGLRIEHTGFDSQDEPRCPEASLRRRVSGPVWRSCAPSLLSLKINGCVYTERGRTVALCRKWREREEGDVKRSCPRTPMFFNCKLYFSVILMWVCIYNYQLKVVKLTSSWPTLTLKQL